MKAINNHPMGKYLKIKVQSHTEDVNGCGRIMLEVDPAGGIQLDDASVYIAEYCPESGEYRGTAYHQINKRLQDPHFVCPMTEDVAEGLGIEL